MIKSFVKTEYGSSGLLRPRSPRLGAWTQQMVAKTCASHWAGCVPVRLKCDLARVHGKPCSLGCRPLSNRVALNTTQLDGLNAHISSGYPLAENSLFVSSKSTGAKGSEDTDHFCFGEVEHKRYLVRQAIVSLSLFCVMTCYTARACRWHIGMTVRREDTPRIERRGNLTV